MAWCQSNEPRPKGSALACPIGITRRRVLLLSWCLMTCPVLLSCCLLGTVWPGLAWRLPIITAFSSFWYLYPGVLWSWWLPSVPATDWLLLLLTRVLTSAISVGSGNLVSQNSPPARTQWTPLPLNTYYSAAGIPATHKYNKNHEMTKVLTLLTISADSTI